MCLPVNLPGESLHLQPSLAHIPRYRVDAIPYAPFPSLNCMEQAIPLFPMEVPFPKDIRPFHSGCDSGLYAIIATATQPSSFIKPMSLGKNGWAVVIM